MALRNLIVLPDGTEIYSGIGEKDNIRKVTLTEYVNDEIDIALGSVCANMLEINIQSPSGNLNVGTGDELTLYKVDETGKRSKAGVFITENPTRSTKHTIRLTAYDRITKLDKDLTDWLSGLEEWPYTLLNFAKMVCNACGVTLTNESIPNGDYQVQEFSARGITGRKLMQWAGQIAGRFCRATTDGNIEFAWYTPSGVTITPNGDRFYYQSGLSYEDYQVAPIEKVQIRLTEDDIGAIWPDESGEKNTYIISGNYLLTTDNTDALLPIAKTLYEQLKSVTYTPCKVKIPACTDIHAGHTVSVTGGNGKTITVYVMKKKQSGGIDTLECTGVYRRDSSSAMNKEDYRALNNKLLELSKTAEGLEIRASATETDLESTKESIADIRLKADDLSVRVSETETRTQESIDSVSGTVETLQKEVSAKMTSDEVQLEIQTAMENGTEKVVTKTGYTFNDEGMTVEKSGSEMSTKITENGMVVKQSGADVLVANNEGVDAKNLHATTYLLVGSNSRFENYGSGRTGCFWIGE